MLRTLNGFSVLATCAALGAPNCLEGQVIGPMCRALDPEPFRVPILEALPRFSYPDTTRAFVVLVNRLDSVVRLAGTIEEERRMATTVGQSAWNVDSIGAEAILAYLVADGGKLIAAGPRIVSIARQQYLRLSGRAGPVLPYLSFSENGFNRAPNAFAAIRQRLSPRESEWVMQSACTAGWLVGAWRTDTSYHRETRWIPPWGTGEHIMQQAFRILGAGRY